MIAVAILSRNVKLQPKLYCSHLYIAEGLGSKDARGGSKKHEHFRRYREVFSTSIQQAEFSLSTLIRSFVRDLAGESVGARHPYSRCASRATARCSGRSGAGPRAADSRA